MACEIESGALAVGILVGSVMRGAAAQDLPLRQNNAALPVLDVALQQPTGNIRLGAA